MKGLAEWRATFTDYVITESYVSQVGTRTRIGRKALHRGRGEHRGHREGREARRLTGFVDGDEEEGLEVDAG